MGELIFRIKRFYRWEKRERRDIIISILAITFIFAFDDKSKAFNIIFWLMNFLKTLIIVGISFMAYDFGMKATALQQGFRAEYRMWPTGLAAGIIITLFSGGKFPLVVPGGLFLHHIMILRLGRFRYGINTVAYGTIAAAGPIANLIVMTLALAIGRQFGIATGLFDFVAFINGVMLIYQLIPLPRLNGIHIFFMSRLAYVFIAATIVAYVLLSLVHFYSWIVALLIGTVCWLLWWYFAEGGKG